MSKRTYGALASIRFDAGNVGGTLVFVSRNGKQLAVPQAEVQEGEQTISVHEGQARKLRARYISRLAAEASQAETNGQQIAPESSLGGEPQGEANPSSLPQTLAGQDERLGVNETVDVPADTFDTFPGEGEEGAGAEQPLSFRPEHSVAAQG